MGLVSVQVLADLLLKSELIDTTVGKLGWDGWTWTDARRNSCV